MSALVEAKAVIEKAGFKTSQDGSLLLRIKSKDGSTVIGSVTLAKHLSDEQARAAAKEALDAAAREPGARR
jgi:hypothetical protein